MEGYIYDLLNDDKWWWQRGRMALVTNLMDKYFQNGHAAGQRAQILEIGCGTGGLLVEVEHRYGTGYGIDMAPEALQLCRERGLTSVGFGDARALPYRDQKFDAVIAVDVIEHVDDDEGALREMHRVSKPGARVILTVPAFQMLWSRRDVEHHHYRRYRVKQVEKKVRAAGFRVLKASYVNLPIFFPLLLMVKSGALSPKQGPSTEMDFGRGVPGLNSVLTWVLESEARVLRRTDLPVGSSIVCVAARAG